MTSKERYIADKSLLQSLPVFYQPWWLDAVCKKWDVALLENENGIIAVYPYQLEKKIGVTLIRPALLTAYNAPFFIDDANFENAHKLLKLLPDNGFHCFHTLPEDDKWRKFLPDYTFTEKITFYIDLMYSEDELLKKLHVKRRNDIRKAQSELKVQAAKLNIDEFYKWYSHTFKEKKIYYPYTKDFLIKINDAAIDNKACLCLKALDSLGKCCGIVWLLYDATTMYFLLSTINPETNHRGAISLLIWEAMLKAKAMGLKIFDFEGSMDKGIAAFFKRFGGEQKQYYFLEKTDSILWKLKTRLLR